MLDPADIKPGMGRDTLDAVAAELFGPVHGRRKRLAHALHAGPKTVDNWYYGTSKVPGPAIVAMRLLVERKQLEELMG